MMGPLHFEDLVVGMRWRTPGATFTKDSIVRFSLEWDYQAFHADEEMARESIFGELVSSGLHSLCMAYRLYNETTPLRGTALAGTGMEKLRWRTPVRPGDTIHSYVEIVELTPHRLDDRGRVRLHFDTCNQNSTLVMAFDLLSIVTRRPDETAARESLASS